MKLIPSMLAAWVIAAPMAGIAASAPSSPTPDNPAASVPAVEYSSAFADYRAAPEVEHSPDQYWRAANEKVAADGMGHAGHSMPSAPAQPAADPSPMEHSQHAMPMDHGRHATPTPGKKAPPSTHHGEHSDHAAPDEHQGHAH